LRLAPLLALWAALILAGCGREAPAATLQSGPTGTPPAQPEPTPVIETPTTEWQQRTIYVARDLVDCPGEQAPRACLQVRASLDDPYTPFAGPIEGFLFEAGHEYELLVEQPGPPGDVALDRVPGLRLVEVLHQERTYGTVGPCLDSYPDQTITLYLSPELTGPLAQLLGQGLVGGVEDAAAMINGAGGICGARLAIQVENNLSDPEQTLVVYERLLAQEPRPALIFSGSDGAGLALRERVIEDQILHLTAGVDAEALYAPPGGWTVGIIPTYSDQFAGFIRWAHNHWEEIRPEGAADEMVVGVIGWDNPFGRGATTVEALAYAHALGATVLPLAIQEVSPTADITPQIQGLLAGGANLIYVQSLSHGPAQVIGTLWGLGAWNRVVVGGVNWAMNSDVPAILGQNAHLMAGFYGVVPYRWWSDTEAPGVRQLSAAFEAGDSPAVDRGAAYLLGHGALFALRDVLVHAVNRAGLENLSGQALFDALEDLGLVNAAGLYQLDFRDGYRAPRLAQIRQAQLTGEGSITFVPVGEFFELPDTRPER
jgi:branched-chain amino acid transport system substrate-binding protein